MKRRFIMVSSLLILLAACKKEEKPYSATTPIPEAADVKLLKELSLCASSDYGTVDKDCLQKNFRPLLGLGPKDELLYDGGFGVNTDGRYFTMHVRKASVSGKTSGTFTLSFYIELHEDNPVSSGNSCTSFRASKGLAFGAPRNDYRGLLVISDLNRGNDSLVSGDNGEVSSFFRLWKTGHRDGELWSPKHTASNLINSGKTIGEIIGEYLEYIEKQEAQE